jgi:hypothetical protein
VERPGISLGKKGEWDKACKCSHVGRVARHGATVRPLEDEIMAKCRGFDNARSDATQRLTPGDTSSPCDAVPRESRRQPSVMF